MCTILSCAKNKMLRILNPVKSRWRPRSSISGAVYLPCCVECWFLFVLHCFNSNTYAALYNPYFLVMSLSWALLNYIENGLAYAIVDPITAESYQRFKANSQPVVFKKFSPAVIYDIAIIQPAHRPASLLVKHFIEQLRGEFSRLLKE